MRNIAPTLSKTQKSYIMQSNLIKVELTKLQTKLKAHKALFEKDNLNWGFIGDLSHIKNKLIELNDLK